LGLGLPASRVLCSRGLRDPAAALAFLKPTLEHLHDPQQLRGLPEAIDRLLTAIHRREPILIYGDYDVDGATSVVILKKAIELAGGSARFHVPHRLHDGYGMRPEIVEVAAAEGVRLIISADTGIRAAAVVRRANELGIDVIITDHHLPESEIPAAIAVLNPNQPGCGYPDKNLCGVGVAFKLVQALFARMNWDEEKRRRIIESFLKLVAIGTVADVVPLLGENRVIVKHGLSGLRSIRNHGLRALLEVAGFGGERLPSATEIAFRIAPRVNAAGRMDTANAAIELFLTNDPVRARELAEQLHAWNRERQQVEAQVIAAIIEECSRSPFDENRRALVFAGPGWHKGVLGIVAGRLAEKFHRPVFVLTSDPETGIAQGSGRSIPCFHLLEALEAMPELFLKFGGHRHAAGLTLSTDRIESFRERLNSFASARLTPRDLVPQLELDAMVELQELNDQNAAELLDLAPFGCGNPVPLLAACDVEIVGPPVVWREKHVRMLVRQNGRTLALKGWNLADRVNDFAAGTRVDVAFSLEEDPYSAARGFPEWTIVLRDLRPAGEAREAIAW